MTRTRRIAGAALALGVALAFAGCGGSESPGNEDRAAAPTSSQSASTPAVTSTEAEPEPVTAAELAWLGGIKSYSRRLNRAVGRTGTITHTTMRRSARLYEECGPMLRRAGDPGRLEPARTIANGACQHLRKAAKLLQQAIAASETGGFVYADTADAERFERALGGAIEEAGTAQYDFRRAIDRAAGIAAGLES